MATTRSKPASAAGTSRPAGGESRHDCLDEASGLYHQGHFRTALGLEMARLERWEKPLGLVVIELPGLEASPRRWRAAGAALLAALRPIDQAARLDDRRLAAILPDAGDREARRLVEEFLKNLKREPLVAALRPVFGLALARPWGGLSPDELLRQAVGQATADPWATAPPAEAARFTLSTAIAADERNLLFDGFKHL